MAYKAFATNLIRDRVAEAIGRRRCAFLGKPWPEQPDTYGPGRQPEPREDYFQRYWAAPLDAVAVNIPLGILTALPRRIEIDAWTQALDGQVVRIAAGIDVTLDFTGLV